MLIWKNIVLLICFFLVTPVALGVSIFSLVAISKSIPAKSQVLAAVDVSQTQNFGAQVYASLPATMASVEGSAQISDARTQIVSQYLERYNSPLAAHASQLVAAADKYGLDFRLTTAIAQQESNLCKKIPAQSYNCWGWGIHSEGTLMFDSFEQGIETVSEGLREEYVDKGYISIADIMSKYTPLSNGSWAEGVTTFMLEME